MAASLYRNRVDTTDWAASYWSRRWIGCPLNYCFCWRFNHAFKFCQQGDAGASIHTRPPDAPTRFRRANGTRQTQEDYCTYAESRGYARITGGKDLLDA